jgi:MFS family permease
VSITLQLDRVFLSSYHADFLTEAGFMLGHGQVLTIAPTKWVIVVLIVIFEIGSLLCAVAPSMVVLILGRAVAGVGGGGIFVSIFTLLSQITRLEQRPILFGLFGALFAISSVVGPLLGEFAFLHRRGIG